MRIALPAIALMIASAFGQTASAATISLDFNSPVAGTLLDANGLGTGFTTRLPGTGANIPIPDPNLNLMTNPGYLTIQSAPGIIGGFGGGVNLPNADLPGVLLVGINNSDFCITAKFDNVVLPVGQLAIYVGTRSDLSIRAGFHQTNQLYLAANLNGAGDYGWSNGNNAFISGDDFVVTLMRSSGLWSLSWVDLTHPQLSGSSLTSGTGFAATPFPELNAESDLYVGLMYTSHPATGTASPALVDYFRVEECPSVPEPTSLALAGFASIGMAVGAWRRRRQQKQQAA